MKKVYLAGPINGRTDDDCMGWREFAKLEIGEERVVDPMRNDYRGKEGEPGIATAIVEADKTDIHGCHAMLVYFDKPSVGTAMEVFYAWQLGRKVFVVNASGKPPSPWLVYHSTAVVGSLEEGIDAAKGAIV